MNEDKTTYLVLATQGRRARENLASEIEVCGEKVQSSVSGKCLGLLISNDLSWRHQVEKVLKSCNSKQNGLWKCTNLLNREQRKRKAEGIILSRLNYCIELVSQGRKEDLEKLQSSQSKAARWVLQTRKRDWSLRGGLKKLGWLSMAQQAAYTSITTSIKVLRKQEPERLFDLLTEESNGTRVRKVMNEKKFQKLKATTRKAWSNRSLRWLEQMPEELRRKDMKLKSSKNELKQWVKHHVPVRGDRILWGRPLTGEMRRRKRGLGGEDVGGGGPEGQHLAIVPEQEMPNALEEGQGQEEEELRHQQRHSGHAGHNLKWHKQIWLGLLMLVLAGGYSAAVVKDREQLEGKLKEEEICRSSVAQKLKEWQKTSGSQGAGGHRGGVWRVKSGEG